MARAFADGKIPASVHYRRSTKPAEACDTCEYFNAGRCSMFNAVVSPTNVCDKWTEIVSDHSVTEHMNKVIGKGYDRAEQIEQRLVRVLEPLFDQAGRHAARLFQERATNFLTASLALTAATDVAPTSTMVALYPRLEEAQALSEDGGEPAERMHVTLAYIGKVDLDLAERIAEALTTVAATHPPLEGTVGGVGAFDDNGNGVPAILLPDVPGLMELRQAVCQAILDGGGDYSREHGYTPHATVAYREPGEADPPERDTIGKPLHFDELHVVQGDRTVAKYPLTGARALTADASTPEWAAPAPDEIFNVAAFVATLRTKTDPIRLALVQSVMTPALNNSGLSFDVTNPLTANVIAQSGQHIKSISETTQLNVMRTINESYNQGLSIPDTAKAIQASVKDSSTVRATMIARTELAGAVNGGSLAAAQIVNRATGGAAAFKKWMTAPGATYPRHETYEGLDGQTVAIDDSFEVGDDGLEYPGDPSGDPGEVINCRCTMSYADSRDGGDEDGGDSGGDDDGGFEIPGTEVSDLSSQMIDQAASVEPAVTSALSGIASDAGGKMAGLEYAVKEQSSLERKIGDDLADARAAGVNTSPAEVAANINDTLRYTMTFPSTSYTKGVDQALASLKADDYNLIKIKNYWGNQDYQGINSILEKNGQRFELQFHTPRGFGLKTDLHDQYRQFQLATDPKTRQRLWDEMAAEQAKNPAPKGAKTIGQLVSHPPPS